MDISNQTTKALIVDDDQTCRALIKALLARWGYEAITCSNGVEALQILEQRDGPQLVILDWKMPEMDGIELSRKILESTTISFTYTIMLTSMKRKSAMAEAIEAGADDFLIKPFDPSELQVRLRAGKRIAELQKKLRFRATHDSLTGLWNHESITNCLYQEIVRAARESTLVGVLLADLDHFKQVNDTYGHLVGDQVLQQTAERMHSVVRPYDVVGRYGGEEFMIVLPMNKSSASDLSTVAERVRRGVGNIPVRTSAGEIPITASVGGVLTQLGEHTDVNSLIQQADAALYQAKRSGRDRVEIPHQGHGEFPHICVLT
ncbi:MAG: diguanylate cyclase [Acidobacteriota bacterium]